jgi:YVTN family beta-propeller protein
MTMAKPTTRLSIVLVILGLANLSIMLLTTHEAPFLLYTVEEEVEKTSLVREISGFLSNWFANSNLYVRSPVYYFYANDRLIETVEAQLAHTSKTSSPTNNNSLVYENPTHNLKLSYPVDWQKIASENNITFYSPNRNANDSFRENIAINILPSGNVPLDKSESLIILAYRQTKPDFRLLDFGAITLAGNPGYKIVYSYSDGEKLLKSLELRTVVGGKSYSFVFTAGLDQYVNYLPVANRILDSLEIQGLTKQPPIKYNYPKLRLGSDPFDIVVDPVTDRLYIANFRFHSVSVIDGSTDKVTSEIKVGRFPSSLDINTDLNSVYVANSRSNTISVIDGSTDDVIKDISVGNHPVTVLVDNTEKGENGLVFVANHQSNTISVIDATKNELLSPAIPVGSEPSGLAVNEIANRLYVANRGSDTVSVIDYFLSNQAEFKNFTIANITVQKYPSDIAINPDTNRIYVANYYSDSISVIDGATNTVSSTIKVGVNPSSIAINPDTNRIYVTNYGSNSVSVIDGVTNRVLEEVAVGNFPFSIFHNPKTHINYVINLGSRTISEMKDRSLLAGITYNINPSHSGHINCNGTRVSDTGYIRYEVGSKIACEAQPNSDYIFRSWSASIPLQSGAASTTAFKSSDYGNVTANFQVPVEVTLPKAYWEQLYIVLISIMVPAVAGWSIPAITAYVSRVRQRKVLRYCMGNIIQIHEDTQNDKDKHMSLLDKARIDIVGKLTQGKINERQYDILNNKISDYLDNANGR